MPALCCGVLYSKKDINTYWCINTDIIKYPKSYVKDTKVTKEVVETYLCKKCGCTIVKIYKYGNSKRGQRLLQTERLSGSEAIEYLEDTIKIRQRQPQVIPLQKVSGTKTIPFIYGASIGAEKQRPRYLSGDWAGDTITTKVTSFSLSEHCGV